MVVVLHVSRFSVVGPQGHGNPLWVRGWRGVRWLFPSKNLPG